MTKEYCLNGHGPYPSRYKHGDCIECRFLYMAAHRLEKQEYDAKRHLTNPYQTRQRSSNWQREHPDKVREREMPAGLASIQIIARFEMLDAVHEPMRLLLKT